MTTFQAVTRHEPDVRVLWLDAHGDYNTPDTTPSGFLGGMCLSAACGVWTRASSRRSTPRACSCAACGTRRASACSSTRPASRTSARSEVANRLRGHKVYVHLDLDVLDPDVLLPQFRRARRAGRIHPARAARAGQRRLARSSASR